MHQNHRNGLANRRLQPLGHVSDAESFTLSAFSAQAHSADAATNDEHAGHKGGNSARAAGPRALDLFCGAGGASMGLHRAGFDVTGVDIRKQPRYPFRFVQADALRPPFDLREFVFIWASPPCQAHCALRHQLKTEHPDLIPQTRAMLEASGVLYVIENVPGAPLRNPILLCGSRFGLRVRRHRLFESRFLGSPGNFLYSRCAHDRQGQPIDVSGTGGRRVTRRANDRGGNTNKPRTIQEARDAMGVDWMTRAELSQAIPPAYAEFIGKAAIRCMASERVR